MNPKIIDIVLQSYYTFIHSNPLQQYGMLGVFVIGLIPSFIIIIPGESVLIPVYQSNPTQLNAEIMFVVFSFSVFISNVFVYLFSHHLTNLVRKENKKANVANHMLSRYSFPIFLAVPSLIFGIGDIILIIAGIKHISFMKIIPFLFIGSFVRSAWGILIAIYLPKIITG